MKAFVSTILFLIGCQLLSAQSFEVPQNYRLNIKDDYTFYEPDIVKCVDWLITTPVNQEKEKRKEASAFLLKWVSGSPNIHINLDVNILQNIKDDKVPDYILIFIGGWVKDAIETNNRQNTMRQSVGDMDGLLAGNVAGFEAVVSFYNNNKGLLPQNESIAKLCKLQKKGKLEAHVKKLMPKTYLQENKK